MVFTLFVWLTFIAVSDSVDVTWSQQGLLNRLARNEGFWLLTFFDCTVSVEGLVKVIVHDETHAHDILVVNLSNHANQLWLKGCQRPEHVAECFTALAWLGLVNHFVRKVDVSFD